MDHRPGLGRQIDEPGKQRIDLDVGGRSEFSGKRRSTPARSSADPNRFGCDTTIADGLWPDADPDRATTDDQVTVGVPEPIEAMAGDR